MPTIPKISGFDSTLALAKSGSLFISQRCNEYGTNIFETRLMLKKVVCLKGEEAAALFYDTNLFKRQGAAPARVQKTLFGQGGVQGLDGQRHRHRKQMFMNLMTPERINALVNEFTSVWRNYLRTWQHQERVELFYQVNEILCRAACKWAGVDLADRETEEKTRDFMALINSAGAVGPKHWRGRVARKKLNRWAAELVEQVRQGQRQAPSGTALRVCAEHRNEDGSVLDAGVAAVELLNFIRPTIAIARFVAFEAVALHDHPQAQENLRDYTDAAATEFVQEVRRYYPFFPAVAAIAKQDVQWAGYTIPKGRWVMLDLYGTNHDGHSWDRPDEFLPERFRQWDGSPFNFIPQGGGDHHQNHRCAGEWITIEIMKAALRLLTQEMQYQVPAQDLRVDPRELPALPKSGMILTHVSRRMEAASVSSSNTADTERARSQPLRH